jgi:hypothetical protein
MNSMHDGKEGGDRDNLEFGSAVIPEINLLYLKYLWENDHDLSVDWHDWFRKEIKALKKLTKDASLEKMRELGEGYVMEVNRFIQYKQTKEEIDA